MPPVRPNIKRPSEPILNQIKTAESVPKKIKLNDTQTKTTYLNMGNLLSTAKRDETVYPSLVIPQHMQQFYQQHGQPGVSASASNLAYLPHVISSLPQAISSLFNICSTTPSVTVSALVTDKTSDANASKATDQIASLMQRIRSGDDTSSAASALFNASTVQVDLLEGNNSTLFVPTNSGFVSNSMLGLSLGNESISNSRETATERQGRQSRRQTGRQIETDGQTDRQTLFPVTTVDLLEGKNEGADFGMNGKSMLGLHLDGLAHHGSSIFGLNLDLLETEETTVAASEK